MTALSDYCENALLDHILGNTAMTAPTNTYLQVHTGDPGEACTAAVANGGTRSDAAITWGAAAARAIANSATITFTNVSDAVTYSWFSIWDSQTPAAGNAIAYGQISPGVPVNIGDDFEIAVGDLDLDFTTGMLTTYAGNAALDHITGRAAWTQPAGHFIKAHTADPTVTGTVAPAEETTRANAGAFSAAAAGASDNDAIISWTSVASTGPDTWSHITGWDTVGPAGGNPLYFGALTTAKQINNGADVEFAAGVLDLALL